MTDQQLQTIVALMAGMQTSIVHLSNLLAATEKISHEDIAASFEVTADKIPDEVKNKQLIQLALRQVASGIRNSQAGAEWQDLISRLLH
jgi:hypothetical protein